MARKKDKAAEDRKEVIACRDTAAEMRECVSASMTKRSEGGIWVIYGPSEGDRKLREYWTSMPDGVDAKMLSKECTADVMQCREKKNQMIRPKI